MSQLLEILMRKMDTNAQRVDGNMQGMQNKMDMNACNLQRMEKEIKTNVQKMDEMRGDVQEQNNKMDANMQTLRGEMQSMGLSLQASMKKVEGIMAEPHGGATEPTGSTKCVGPAMETGEVRTTSDATTIIGETCKT